MPGLVISPASASLRARGQLQFTATLGGTPISACWQAVSGTIVTSTGFYTASAFPGTDTITAQSCSDPSLHQSAQVTVIGPASGIGLSISPQQASLGISQTLQFSVQVLGATNPAVTWQAATGSIDSTGLYRPRVPGQDTVTVTSVEDPTVTAQATVSVPSPISITSAAIDGPLANAPQARVTGAGFDRVVTASVDGRAVAFILQSPQQLTLTVPSGDRGGVLQLVAQDSTATAVLSGFAPTVVISPAAPSVAPGDTLQFSASVTGAANTTVHWSCLTGEIENGGLYFARGSANDVVTATSDTDERGVATVVVHMRLGSPSIGAIDPPAGVIGQTVHLTGANLGVASAVSFGDASAKDFVVLGSAALDVAVPADAPALAPIFVTTPLGTAQSQPFALEPPHATVSYVTPQAAHPGEALRITGDLRLAIGVRVGGQTVEFDEPDDQTINLVIPPTVTSGDIEIDSPGFTTHFDGLELLTGPFILSITSAGDLPGSQALIEGSGFQDTQYVVFENPADDETADFEVLSPTRLAVTIPEKSLTSRIYISTLLGTVTSSPFTVQLPPPLVQNIAPLSGRVGDRFHIMATHAFWVTQVTLAGVAIPFYPQFDEQHRIFVDLLIQVPAGAVSGPLEVTSAAATETWPQPFAVLADQPIATSFSPSAQQPGYPVSVSGTEMDLATSVTVGGVAALITSAEVDLLVFTVPAGATTGAIVIGSAKAVSQVPGVLTVLPVAPYVTSVTPTAASPGATVAFTAQYEDKLTGVLFGTAPGFVLFNGQGQAGAVVVPEQGATDGQLTLSATGLPTWTSGPVVHILPALEVQPSSGPAGTTVTLSAPGVGAATEVRFGGVGKVPPLAPGFAVQFTRVSDDQLTLVVPANFGTGPIHVFADAPQAAYAGGPFQVQLGRSRRLLVVPVTLADSPDQCTPAALGQQFFGAAPSVASFFAEASGGNLQLTGDVSEPVISSCTWDAFANNQCGDYAPPPAVDLTGYDDIGFVSGFPADDLAFVAYDLSLGSLSPGPFRMAARDCSSDSLGVPATAVLEHFKVQSGTFEPLSFIDESPYYRSAGEAPNRTMPNAPTRADLGWLAPGALVEATSGTFRLAALDSGPELQVLHVSGPWTSYDISYRAPVGVFGRELPPAYVERVAVHTVPNFNFLYINQDPVVLGAGESFTDPTMGLTLSVASTDASGATVSVAIAP